MLCHAGELGEAGWDDGCAPLPLTEAGGRLLALWRAVREWLLAPLLAPLRTAVRAFFAYLRLNETQAAAHTSVAVPL